MPGVEVTARDHGTSVAGLIAGTGEFRGMAPGSKIYHARAFEGGKSTMECYFLLSTGPPRGRGRIINMSFVGPKNEFLEEACAAGAVTRHRLGSPPPATTARRRPTATRPPMPASSR